MRFLATLVLATLSLFVRAEVIRNHVVAVVAGEAITDWAMDVEAIVENADRYVAGGAPQISENEKNRLLQQLLIRTMVAEENRVLKFYRIPKSDVDKRLDAFRRKMGKKNFDDFLSFYRLSESDLRKSFSNELLLEKTLNDQEDVETWLKQLRRRHSVMMFKS